MKDFMMSLAITGVLTLLAGTATAQSTKPTLRQPLKPVLMANVEEMRAFLKLPEELVNKMVDVLVKTEKDQEDLAKQYGQEKPDWGRMGRSPASLHPKNEKEREYFKRREEINAKAAAELDSLLSAEQLDKWREHKYLEPVLTEFKKADLTDDQVAKIRTEFKRGIAEIKPDGSQRFDYNFRANVQDKLVKLVYAEFLTPAQLEKMLLKPALERYKAANLTDVQLVKITEQWTQSMKKARPDALPYGVIDDLDSLIYGVMTGEQREKHLLEQYQRTFKICELAEDQLARIKDKCRTLAKDLPPGAPPSYVDGQVSWFIYKEVLTDEQKAKLRIGSR